MPRFKKQIVKVGSYDIPDGGGGTRRIKITDDTINNWHANATAMLDKGLRIPAPWNHDKDSLPVKIGNDGTLPSSKENAGYWDHFNIEADDKGRRSLMGTVDVPRVEDATRIGTSVKDTSIYIRPEYKDGDGTTWKNSPMHIALVTHPIESGQSNFVSATDSLALSMAQFVKMSDDSEDGEGGENPVPPKASSDNDINTDPLSGMKDLMDALGLVKISLPDDTTPGNLVERLTMVLRQKATDEGSEGDTRNPPEGAEKQPAPVAMATQPMKIEGPDGKPVELTAKQVDAVAAAHAKQHKTKPEADATAMSQQAVINDGLLSIIGNNQKQEYARRIGTLVTSGRIGKEYADKELVPMLDGFAMSQASFIKGEDGKIVVAPTPLDATLHALEMAIPAGNNLAGPSLLEAGVGDQTALAMLMAQGRQINGQFAGKVEQLPEDALGIGIPEMTDKESDAFVDDFMYSTGYSKKKPALAKA